ncbi:MAG TPA: thiamine pyrophosphate-dependent dehydrogenase E1 component subunit alpha [Anaerolineales bacterium]|nr:thiamine pyrophosphate-dependent dehydrogenase E1 component subunit alpha [Anaerolineales bacterium]
MTSLTIPPDRLLQMYRDMTRIRKFEEKVYYLFLQGQIVGTIHQYQGQEAVAVGVCSALRREDCITSTHRPHGHCIAKGVSIHSMMAELFARATGCCKAKGGSMHMGDVSVGAMPAIAIVAGGVTIAAGMGLAFKFQKSDRVVACFFGDGAVNEGAFHEGVNLAAIWKLPVVFVCENNLYAASTPMQLTTPIAIAERAAAYGIPGVVVDGNDVMVVYEATRAAVERARSGGGPTLLECQTYRTVGHSRGDASTYRPKEEVEAWKQKDPIERLRRHSIANGVGAGLAPALAAVDREVEKEIEAAVVYAQESPPPRPEDALLHVYGEEAAA